MFLQSILLGAVVLPIQLIFAISSTCEEGFITVASNPQGACLDILGLVGILQSTSAIQPLQSWLQNACAQPVCTPADLNFTAVTIAEACQTDLSSPSFQLNQASIGSLVETVQASYSLVQSVLCVKNVTTNAFVVVELAEQVLNFNSTANLYVTPGTNGSSNAISPFNWASLTAQLPLCATINLPTNMTCSEDVLALYAMVFHQEQQMATSPDILNNCATQCGASFVSSMSAASTGLPSGYSIQNTAPVYTATPSVSPVSTSSNNAKTLLPDGTLIGIAISVLAVIASAFIVLA